MNRPACVLALASAVASALAQPAPLDARTGGVLVGDQTLDAIFLTRDLDGDGAALSPGEVNVYFDGTNASGLPSPTGNVFTIFQSATGDVYFGNGEGANDAVYRLRDLNADGDANDAGEATAWFTWDNGAGLPLTSPGGLWETEPGVLFILNAGTVATPGDAIYRTEDLNGDGDANDPGEATVWFDIEAVFPDSTAFELVFIGETAYWTDFRSGDPDAIMFAQDRDGNGRIDDGEWGPLLEQDNPFGVPIGFALKTDGQWLYVADNLSSRDQTVWRVRDIDGSGAIDSPDEAELLWQEANLPAGAGLGSVFTLALGPDSRLALGSSGSDAQDAVYLLRDLDGDGAYLSPGETAVWVDDGGGSANLASRVRALEFILPPCRADLDGDGDADVNDFFLYLDLFAAGDPRADFTGDGTVDVNDFFAYLDAFAAGC